MIPLGASRARLDPEQFQACFLSWVQAINNVLPAQQSAIDGKTARRSPDCASGKAAIQMVSAWATETHLVLAQRHVKDPRDTQRGLSKRAEMWKGCCGGEWVIVCHTESVVR